MPGWMRRKYKFGHGQIADVVIRRIGEEAVAVLTKTGEMISRGRDHGKVLLDSVKTLAETGGKIYIDWTYERDGWFNLVYPSAGIPIKYEEIELKEVVVIEGVGSSSINDRMGTVLYVKGTGNNIMFHIKSAVGGWAPGRIVFRNLSVSFANVSRGMLFDHIQVDFENVALHIFNPLRYEGVEPYTIYISGSGPPGARAYWNALAIIVGYSGQTTPVPIIWTHRADWVYIDELFIWLNGDGAEVIRVDNQLFVDRALIMLWNDQIKNNVLFKLRGNSRTLSINDMMIMANDWDNPYRNTNKIFEVENATINRVEVKRLFLPAVISPGTQITITDEPSAIYIDKIVEQQSDYTLREKPWRESHGTVTITSDGTSTKFEVRVPHGLVSDKVVASATTTRPATAMPSYISTYLEDTDEDGFKENIVITIGFDTAPADGEVVEVYWEARVVG